MIQPPAAAVRAHAHHGRPRGTFIWWAWDRATPTLDTSRIGMPAKADLIIYDRLVSPALLELARPDAARICVTEPGEPPSRSLADHQRTDDAAARRAPKWCGSREATPRYSLTSPRKPATACRGIDYENVPGLAASLGAAAHRELPRTHRRCASAVAFVTGHENPAKAGSALDADGFARCPGTLVLYMSVARIPEIAQSLLQGGKPANTPVLVVQNSTRGDQAELRSTLGELSAETQLGKFTAPCIFIIGPVVDLQPSPTWSRRRLLSGARVLVARPREQGLELARRLEALHSNCCH